MPRDPYAVLRALLRAEATRGAAEPETREPRPPTLPDRDHHPDPNPHPNPHPEPLDDRSFSPVRSVTPLVRPVTGLVRDES
jgi:hypothetical protein